MAKKLFKIKRKSRLKKTKKYISKMKLRYKILGLFVLILPILVFFRLSSPSDINDICTIFREKYKWYDYAKASSNKWGTEIPVMMAIMRQESGFRGYVKPPREKILGIIPWNRPSSAKGYAQAIDGTWQSYKDDAGNFFSRRCDFENAIDFIGWHMKTQGQGVAGVPLNSTYQQYLVYHE